MAAIRGDRKRHKRERNLSAVAMSRAIWRAQFFGAAEFFSSRRRSQKRTSMCLGWVAGPKPRGRPSIVKSSGEWREKRKADPSLRSG